MSDNHRGRNYRLCEAINLTKLGMVAKEMIDAGADERLVGRACSVVNEMLEILRNLNP